jgi:DNA polymerase elongation subunit (family B)
MCIRDRYWYEEIKLVIELCVVKQFKIKYAVLSKNNSKGLSCFVETLNALRVEGGLKKEIGKLLINSFYGRLGLADDLTLLKLKQSLNGETSYGYINGSYLVKDKIKKIPKSNIAIAAAITSKARLKLYEGFLEVINAGGRLIYCDTDSIFAAFKKDNNVEDRFLGKNVKFDTSKPNTIISDSIFINPKTYGLVLNDGSEIIKIKGINTNTLTFKGLKSCFINNLKSIPISSEVFYTKNLTLNKSYVNKHITLQNYNKRL